MAERKGSGKTKPEMPEPPTIRATALASEIGVGVQLVYKGCESGEIKATRLGGRWIIPRSERDRLLRR
jgi:hypothetical protein